MVRYGWRHFQHATPGIQTAADLVPEAAHGGRLGLRLTARADNPENPPAMIEMPPIWVTSPAVPVQAGQIVRIHGWVNVPTAIIGSVDGLLVVESLTGEEMALRLDKTDGLAGVQHAADRAASGPHDADLGHDRPGRGPPRRPDNRGPRALWSAVAGTRQRTPGEDEAVA